MIRKVYAIIKILESLGINEEGLWEKFSLNPEQLEQLDSWWNKYGLEPQNIASSSDRLNLQSKNSPHTTKSLIKHPISGQEQEINRNSDIEVDKVDLSQLGEQELFWWLWRFLPELQTRQKPETFLIPAHPVLPDCPIHSYASTVSALVGAMYPSQWQEGDKPEHPYLLLFTFSPVQEFIKASRKFVDFWAGSYLLHYLGAKLCWYIGTKYGADAVITPSLWGQEIIDALMIKEFDKDYTIFQDSFKQYIGVHPVENFDQKNSSSLSTAGFPNVITALLPSKEDAEKLGSDLKLHLKNIWSEIALKVREDIKKQVIDYLHENLDSFWDKIHQDFDSDIDTSQNIYYQELQQLKQGGCWEWNKLWDAQINHTWETYWTAIPLGNPDQPLSIDNINPTWKQAQENIANPRQNPVIPTEFEENLYPKFNVGTWWGAIQARLGQSIQAVKNTRSWRIPTAPGERSTLSGQYSAVHPRLIYTNKFKEGGGVRESSMRLFWRLMGVVYKGLFNGSEKLNAIELTKRMAWNIGGVAESLGIDTSNIDKVIIDNKLVKNETIDYESLIRFPNLSAIASARFIYDNPEKTKEYWKELRKLVKKDLSGKDSLFFSRTRLRPNHILKTDQQINPNNLDDKNYNGIMFSSKWLADDLECDRSETQILRSLVDQAHKEAGFGDASPADWWVIVLGDGDSMGKYVSGRKLKPYQHYLNEEVIDETIKNNPHFTELKEKTKKRMGPATHVGLNRALLDFSNRLVPYLTQQRFCGKVVYSGGDDVMAVLPLTDLPEYLLSVRSAWSGTDDPFSEFESRDSGYWHPVKELEGLKQRPYFTMGKDATMSLGIVIAHKSVPLPTVLENLWTAEKDKAKKIAGKDGLCFRVIYGGGNVLEALMKGSLLFHWWDWVKVGKKVPLSRIQGGSKISQTTSNESLKNLDLSPLLYRLAEELPLHTCITEEDKLISKATEVIINKRDEKIPDEVKQSLINWLDEWEKWAYDPVKYSSKSGENEGSTASETNKLQKEYLGTNISDLAKLLRFTAFWLDKMHQHQQWTKGGQ